MSLRPKRYEFINSVGFVSGDQRINLVFQQEIADKQVLMIEFMAYQLVEL